MSKQASNDSRLDQRVRKFERHVVEEIQLTDTAQARTQVRRTRAADIRFAAAWLGLWALLTAAGLFSRNAWPTDETRMLGIAWEMWAYGDLWVPYLNGQPDLHPPLFFWLVHLGWWIGGVTEQWPRLLPGLGVLASLVVAQRLAHRLWPAEREVVRYVPLLLLGTISFALAANVTLPETWLVFSVLLALWGLLIQWRTRDHRAWLLTGLGLALGALVAGALVFVYFLPIAVLAPLWARAPQPQWRHWYADIAKAALLALAAVGGWLTMVGVREGGPQVVLFLSHAWDGMPLDLLPRHQHWWWFAWAMPVVFLPWSVLPLAWMRLWYVRREPVDGGFAFCLAWCVFPLALLWLLPYEQPQSLLPLAPAGALLAGRLLLSSDWRDVYQDHGFAGMALPLMAVGAVMMVLPRLPRVEWLPEFLWHQSPIVGLVIIAVGIATAWLPLKDVGRRVFDIAALSMLLVVFAMLGVASRFDSIYPLDQVGAVLSRAEADGRALAHVGEYRGEFHFAGRLREPIAVVEPERVDAWAAEHPNGAIITYAGRWQPRVVVHSATLLETNFRNDQLRVLDAQQVLSIPAASGP